MTVTRRSLLGSMAKLGGAGAVAETLAVWDFLKPPPALAASFALPRDSGGGKTVVILGAGVSGLCRGLRARSRRLRLRDPRGAAPRRRAQPDAAARRHVPGDEPPGADRRIRRGALSQCRPRPHPASPRQRDRLLPPLRRRDAALYLREPRQPRAFLDARQRPHRAGARGALQPAGPRRGIARQVQRQGRARPAGERRRPRQAAGHAGEVRRSHQRAGQGLLVPEPGRPRRAGAAGRRRDAGTSRSRR